MAADHARPAVAAEATGAPHAHPVEVEALRVAPAVTGRARRRRRAAPVAIGTQRRQHGAGQPGDRAELERAGWRTTLEFRENVVRGRGGRLQHVIELWRAEAERVGDDGETVVVAAEAMSAATAWSRLRTEADLAHVARRRRGATPGVPADRAAIGATLGVAIDVAAAVTSAVTTTPRRAGA